MAFDPKIPDGPSSSTGSTLPNNADEGILGSDNSGVQPGEGDRPEDWKDPPASDDLGFDPESPDVADPEVDPLHPARTGNEITSDADYPIDDDEEPPQGTNI